jgi:hypothetical protein
LVVANAFCLAQLKILYLCYSTWIMNCMQLSRCVIISIVVIWRGIDSFVRCDCWPGHKSEGDGTWSRKCQCGRGEGMNIWQARILFSNSVLASRLISSLWCCVPWRSRVAGMPADTSGRRLNPSRSCHLQNEILFFLSIECTVPPQISHE